MDDNIDVLINNFFLTNLSNFGETIVLPILLFKFIRRQYEVDIS